MENEPKQKTLKDLLNKKANQSSKVDLNAYANGLDDGAKWQAEQDKNKYSEEEVQQLLSFIREVRDNWDCDTDAHRYNTPCRCCEATQILEQFKKK